MAQYGEPADIMGPADKLPLTYKCKHYEDYSEMPQHLAKYWYQRNTLFKLYDFDIQLTDDAWFGVTAEPIALQISQELITKASTRHHKPRVIIDMFAGAGGNTIAFARAGHWDRIIGIELDPSTLACAQHNAHVYGVADKITWIHGDCIDFINRLKYYPWTLDRELQLFRNEREALRSRGTPRGKSTALEPVMQNVELFASPPWGGPDYAVSKCMDLDAMQPFGVDYLHMNFSPMAHAMFLPRNGDLRQLANLVPDDSSEKLDVVQYLINGASKGLVAYYPADEMYEDE